MRLARAARALAALGLIAWIYQIIHSGGLYAVYGRAYGFFWADTGYVGEAFQFGLPGALLLLLARSGWRLRPADLVWIGIGLLPLLGHGLLGARRGPTFIALVGVAVMWYLVRARRPRLGPALLGGLAIGLLLLFLLANRDRIYLGAEPDFTGAGQAPTFAVGPGNEFVFGAGAALHAEALDEFAWGRRYLVVLFVRPIPRSLWPTKYADAARFLNIPSIDHVEKDPQPHRFHRHDRLDRCDRLGAGRHLRPLDRVRVGLPLRRVRGRVGLWPRLPQGAVAGRLLARALCAHGRALGLLRHAGSGCLRGPSAAARRRDVARLALRHRRRPSCAGRWSPASPGAPRELLRSRLGDRSVSGSPQRRGARSIGSAPTTWLGCGQPAPAARSRPSSCSPSTTPMPGPESTGRRTSGAARCSATRCSTRKAQRPQSAKACTTSSTRRIRDVVAIPGLVGLRRARGSALVPAEWRVPPC